MVSHSDQAMVVDYRLNGNPYDSYEVGSYPMGIDISALPQNPAEQYAFVACRDDNSVAVISLDHGLEYTWDAGLSPYDLRAATINDEWRLYIVNQKTPLNPALGQVTVLDRLGNLITTIPLGARPMGVDVAAYYNFLYVVNNGSSSVYCIDMVTNTVIDTIRLHQDYPQPANPIDVAISPIAVDGEYRGIITETTHREIYVFSISATPPYNSKIYEGTTFWLARAESLHGVTVVVQ